MSRTVLVIEDDADIRELAICLLERAGFTALTVDCGEAALALLAETSVVLVIQDIMLPGIDGWEIVRRLRAEAATAHLPVLVFTVHSEEVVLEHSGYASVQGRIPKPFTREAFLAAVEGAFAAECPA